MSVFTWRCAFITFNFLSSSVGNQQRGKSQNESISFGEAKLLKIMKILKISCLRLVGHVDLGIGPGHPHVSFQRRSKSYRNGGN